tara:strand:+ start:1583 stop:1693 length:111 start_codon:yes stop_codon:yes gene_type:complete
MEEFVTEGRLPQEKKSEENEENDETTDNLPMARHDE